MEKPSLGSNKLAAIERWLASYPRCGKGPGNEAKRWPDYTVQLLWKGPNKLAAIEVA